MLYKENIMRKIEFIANAENDKVTDKDKLIIILLLLMVHHGLLMMSLELH